MTSGFRLLGRSLLGLAYVGSDELLSQLWPSGRRLQPTSTRMLDPVCDVDNHVHRIALPGPSSR